jgi:hypothetical protein
MRYKILVLLAPLVLFISIYSCHTGIKSPAETDADIIAEGKVLSIKYCSNCHKYPNPSLIDKTTWERGVLPAMAVKMGMEEFNGQFFANTSSMISNADWIKVVAFYKAMAPTKLNLPGAANNLKKDWAIFSLKRPQNTNSKQLALTTLVSYNPNDGRIYSADGANNLYKWDKTLKPTLVSKLSSAATGAIFSKTINSTNEGIFTCIGILPPLDISKGQIIKYDLTKKNINKAPEILSDSLPRAVQSVAADFNKDGLMDYAVCGFGHDKGGLYWVKQLPSHQFKTLPIRMVPGGSQLITGDFNHDGWPDIMCLFAQADEGIWMFLNDQKGGFKSVNVLRFPPIYGSSSFQLVDFNHDGYPDILYTAGDNSDYSKVLKPYHGVYIFLNDGKFNFKQQYFYHINGCTKAIAADFKKNGSLDIAVISFFADFENNPSEGFVYLEQAGKLNFVPHQIPINRYGRWLTMEVSDYNEDGYPDIILGNFSMGGFINQNNVKPTWDIHEPLIVLENKGTKP